jgi:hypothetical protein
VSRPVSSSSTALRRFEKTNFVFRASARNRDLKNGRLSTNYKKIAHQEGHK